MDISFKEKSAWGSLLGLLAVSAYYFPAALDVVSSADGPGSLIGFSIVGFVALIIVESIYHGIIAVGSRNNLVGDERDELIDLKAERLAGFTLGFLTFWIIGHIVATTAIEGLTAPSVLAVAVWLLAALTASEVVKLAAVIWRYRRGFS